MSTADKMHLVIKVLIEMMRTSDLFQMIFPILTITLI